MDPHKLAQQNGNVVDSTDHVIGEATEANRLEMEVSALLERFDKMNQGLNSMKSQKENLTAQMDDLKIRIGRQEGAILMMEQIINEKDPMAFRRQAAQQQAQMQGQGAR